MMNKTRLGRKACLDHLLGQAELPFPAGVYLSLHRDDPTEFGLLTDEFSGDGYARMRIDQLLADAILESGQISNSAPIVSAVPTQDWPEVTHHGISHSASGGTLVYQAPTVASRVVEAGDPYRVDLGQFVCAELGNKTLFARKAWLDHVFGRHAYAFPDHIWLALLTASPTIDGDLDDELSGGGYARVDIINLLSAADLTTGELTNSAEVLFAPATANWPAVTHLALVDAETGGNVLYFGAASTPRTTLTDDRFRLRTNQLIVAEQ